MPSYKFKAIDGAGNVVEAVQNAAGKEQLIESIRSNGSRPVFIEEYSIERGISLSGFNLLKPKVRLREISVFCRQFYTMLHTGIPIINCLDILKEQTENKTLKASISGIYEEVQTGSSFSDSLRKHAGIFPELFINMVEAGEASGNLDEIMDRMSVHYDKEAKLSAKIGSSMIYPFVLLVLIIVVVVLMLVKVFPTFATMFEGSGVELPLPTQILMSWSDSLIEFWYIYLSVIAIIVIVFNRFAATSAGKAAIDGFVLRLPVFGPNIKKIITARFARTLSTLMSSGIPLLEGLEITSKVVGNSLAEQKLKIAQEEVRRGVNLATPIKEAGLFPPMVYSMIMVGEESGSLDEILESTADFYDAEVETAMQAMVSVIEPIMIIIMACVVGLIVVSLFLPMLDMIQTIG